MTQADSKNSITAPVDTTRRFETLKDAEDALMEQGFKLVPDTCNWIDDAAQIDAGVYPVEEAHGVSKYRIEYRSRHHRTQARHPQTRLSTRRGGISCSPSPAAPLPCWRQPSPSPPQPRQKARWVRPRQAP